MTNEIAHAFKRKISLKTLRYNNEVYFHYSNHSLKSQLLSRPSSRGKIIGTVVLTISAICTFSVIVFVKK